MKHRILPITVFLFFILTAIFSGRNNYRTTRNEIAADLNQALAKMIAENGTTVITQDTIRSSATICQSRRLVRSSGSTMATPSVYDGNLWTDRLLQRFIRTMHSNE